VSAVDKPRRPLGELRLAGSLLGRFVRADAASRDRPAVEAIVGGLTVVAIALLVAMPYWIDPGSLFIALSALTLGLMGLALNILLGTTGLVSFGQAMFFGFGAFTVAWLVDVGHLTPIEAFLLTPAVGLATGFVFGLVVLRATELYFSLLTLGIAQLMFAVIHGWYGFSLGDSGRHGNYLPNWLLQPNDLYWFSLGVVAFCALLLFVITRSPFGSTLRAIRENRLRAQYSGIWVRSYELWAYVIAAIFTSVAGGLYAMDQGQAYAGLLDWSQSAPPIIVTLVGGMHTFLGPVAGAFFYTFLQNWVSAKTIYWDLIIGIVVLFVAIFLPGGLYGGVRLVLRSALSALDRARHVRRRRRSAPQEASAIEQAAEELPVARERGRRRTREELEQLPELLRIEGLAKSFGGLHAVRDVSFGVREGTLHAIIGPNGAGKSTLFNLITGYLRADAGHIFLRGEDVTGVPPWQLVKRGVGRSFQQANLFWNLTTLENVAVPLASARGVTRRIWGDLSAGHRDDAHSILRRLGLAEHAAVPAAELSHGDHRALEIAATLAVESKLLLLDEPTAGMSPRETEIAVRLVERIVREEGLTAIFVEHDMEIVFAIADWVTVMAEGSVLAEGTPDEIRRNPLVIRAYLGADDEELEAEEDVARAR
jgi:ABC-type branched-subunit amino acid transport system ATPase component/ABC-type branched-subunit amino acid transport system permease subunit